MLKLLSFYFQLFEVKDDGLQFCVIGVVVLKDEGCDAG